MAETLLVHGNLDLAGGGDAVAVWILQAQQQKGIDLLCWSKPPCWEKFNAFYGTALKSELVTVYTVPLWWRACVVLFPLRLDLLKQSLLARYARYLKKKKAYRVLFSSWNEMDFGDTGLQYIHFPSKLWPSLAWYKCLSHYLGRWSDKAISKNTTLCNSRFISEKFRLAYGQDAQVVYPPVKEPSDQLAWENKALGFVCLGRFSVEKKQLQVIEILKRVRRSGWDVQLHIIGSGERSAYCRQVIKACAAYDWITLHMAPVRDEVDRILMQQRYGIHAMEEEHFGMAVAEMQKAGCIPFVHKSGGPVEIVGNRPEIMFSDSDEAVEKILAVLQDSQTQQDLLSHLQQQSKLYSQQRFQSQIQEALDGFPG